MSAGAGSLRITEIFHSIQGESSRAGRPCVFVRLTGCSLRCRWCDTAYAFSGGTTMTLDDILEEVSKYRTRLVEITGGEPLEQDGVYALMETLVAGGFTVMVETGGQVPLNRVPAGVVKIIDVKCPDSGECGTFASGNLDLAADTDEFKFVLASRTDYEWARAFCRERLAGKPQTILFSPVHGTLDPSDLSGWVLSDGLDVRVQLQIHKHIWGAAARGV